MKKLVIKSVSSKNRVANIIAKKIRGAVSIFSDAPAVLVEEGCETYTTISIFNEKSHLLTFSEMDVVREVVDIYKEKYEYGTIGYIMDTKCYLTKDGKHILHMPVMEISVRFKNW
jgi:hypothetical protein